MIDFGSQRAELAERIFEEGGLEFGAFRLKHHDTQPDALLSTYKINLRTPEHPTNPGRTSQKTLDLAAGLMYDQLQFAFNNFAGIPHAGEPLADALQLWFRDRLNYGSLARLTLEKSEIEGKRQIVGVEGDRVGRSAILIDDVITQAHSKLEVIDLLEAQDLHVRAILVVVDRQEGGREQLERRDCKVYSVFRATELFDFYLQAGLVSPRQVEDLQKYLKQIRRRPEPEEVQYG